MKGLSQPARAQLTDIAASYPAAESSSRLVRRSTLVSPNSDLGQPAVVELRCALRRRRRRRGPWAASGFRAGGPGAAAYIERIRYRPGGS